jgi:hypothetical protein
MAMLPTQVTDLKQHLEPFNLVLVLPKHCVLGVLCSIGRVWRNFEKVRKGKKTEEIYEDRGLL